jgi:hypothetical protein
MSDKDWYDIIAIRFGEVIHFGQVAMELLHDKQDYDQLISRSEFKFMSRLDLGDKWGKYAEYSPTLFFLNDEVDYNVRLIRPYCHRMT